MKPTIENLRKVAGGLTDPRELSILKDAIVFYMAGVRESAHILRRSRNDVEDLLDKARAAEDFINERIRALMSR